MKKILLITLLIVTLFTSCTNKMHVYGQNPSDSKHPKAWQALLLLPDERYPKSSVKHYVQPAFMSAYLKTNPGFIQFDLFNKAHKGHTLSQLSLWYSASFFYNQKIIHYMVMEFPTPVLAKAYVKRLLVKNKKGLQRILRFENILFSFTLSDFNNNILNRDDYPDIKAWIDEKIKTMTEQL